MQEHKLEQLQEKVQHGDIMLPFVQYVTLLPMNFTSFAMHWHKEVEIIYMQSGYCEINVDLEHYVLRQGDIVFIKPQAIHSLQQYQGENGCLFSWLLDINMLSYGATDACYVKYLKPFLDGKIEYPQVISKMHPSHEQLERQLLEIHEVCDEKASVLELNIKWRLEKLFYTLFKEVFVYKKLPNEQKQDTLQAICNVLEYIQENYQKTLTIGELAELLHFSDTYFMRFFKKCTGVTCVEYINEYRMNKAVELLQNTELTIMDIAMQVGMHNISYFNRIFKKKYNMTPKEYRKRVTVQKENGGS